jgi:rRNA pseudouridine-1189 N-methylase Emg1 (Nep1/Mra1 family)
MTRYPDMIAYPHGTPARARWHYRRGHKPLRMYCVKCADANALDKAMKTEKRERERS